MDGPTYSSGFFLVNKSGGGCTVTTSDYPWNPLSTLILMVLAFLSATNDCWNGHRLGDHCLPSIFFFFSNRKIFVPYSGGISINLPREESSFHLYFFFYHLCISKNCFSVFKAFQEHVSLTFKFLLSFPQELQLNINLPPYFVKLWTDHFCLVYLSFAPSFLVLSIMNLM